MNSPSTHVQYVSIVHIFCCIVVSWFHGAKYMLLFILKLKQQRIFCIGNNTCPNILTRNMRHPDRHLF